MNVKYVLYFCLYICIYDLYYIFYYVGARATLRKTNADTMSSASPKAIAVTLKLFT